jgi:hypothetical protein
MSWPANSFRWGFEPAVEFGHFGLHRFEAREDACGVHPVLRAHLHLGRFLVYVGARAEPLTFTRLLSGQ